MDWADRVARLRQWTRGGERAPHKPLLLLYALGRFQLHGNEPIVFSEAEEQLKQLLREFGPPCDTSPGYHSDCRPGESSSSELVRGGILEQTEQPELLSPRPRQPDLMPTGHGVMHCLPFPATRESGRRCRGDGIQNGGKLSIDLPWA
jgi:hypothetical protein